MSNIIANIKLRASPTAIVGWALAAVAFVSLTYELLAFALTGTYRMIPIGEVWFAVHVGSLNVVQAVVQRYLHPFLWDPLLVTLLQWPAWSLLGAPAAVVIAAAPRRRA
jgi:hypothetical protein